MSDDGEGGKREGMERAGRHADPHWWQCMLESCLAVAQRKPFYDAEDVVRWCAKHHPNATTHEKRAIGPLMTATDKLGYGVLIDRWNKSTLPQCHRRPMQLRYSLIYRGPVPRARPRRVTPIDPRQFTMDFVR